MKETLEDAIDEAAKEMFAVLHPGVEWWGVAEIVQNRWIAQARAAFEIFSRHPLVFTVDMSASTFVDTSRIMASPSEETDIEWEYGASWLEENDRVYMPTENDWRAGVEVDRMNHGYPFPEENYVVRRRKAGEWMPVNAR